MQSQSSASSIPPSALQALAGSLSLDQLRALDGFFAASQDCVKLLTSDGVILNINPPGLDLLELEETQDVIGQSWWSIWPDSAHAAMQDAVGCGAKGASMRFQALRETRRGNDRKWDVSLSPIFDTGGSVAALLVVSQDITANLSGAPKT
ncbi:PAS domain-containing protein [Pseudaestuariivita rosea]|uniref:PAS domain-containing protein n=1 Tax=Pseudaestuariivita rosea TaxID=2763263 RepID=UPI001ABA68C3|nr:PAS domain-containing protein [Pseudaestuariivita rosea]